MRVTGTLSWSRYGGYATPGILEIVVGDLNQLEVVDSAREPGAGAPSVKSGREPGADLRADEFGSFGRSSAKPARERNADVKALERQIHKVESRLQKLREQLKVSKREPVGP